MSNVIIYVLKKASLWCYVKKMDTINREKVLSCSFSVCNTAFQKRSETYSLSMNEFACNYKSSQYTQKYFFSPVHGFDSFGGKLILS